MKYLRERLQKIARLFVVLLLASTSSLGISSRVLAQDFDSNDLQSVISKTPWYDPNGGACSASSSSVSLIGSDNVEKAFNYFVTKGLSSTQSAGILGNLMWESGVNPSQQEHTPISGRGGYGIAQWTAGRRDALEAAAAAKGVAVDDLGFQLDFLWGELTTSYKNSVLTPLLASTTLSDATNIVLIKFEAPKTPNLSDRLKLAQAVLDTYGGGAGGGNGSLASASCTPAGNGQDTKYIDGFTIYSQYDPSWKNDKFGSSTIGESGCGPTAMAMIITALTGSTVTPDVTADYATSQNLYEPGVGSSWLIAKVLAEHWGLKATFIGADVSKIVDTLANGGLVIGSGSGSLPFTAGGHYIVIRGVTADGKFKVGDSAHTDTNTQDWDPAQLVSQMHSGSVYAISQ